MHLVQTEYVQANTVYTNYHVAGMVDKGTKTTTNSAINNDINSCPIVIDIYVADARGL